MQQSEWTETKVYFQLSSNIAYAKLIILLIEASVFTPETAKIQINYVATRKMLDQ